MDSSTHEGDSDLQVCVPDEQALLDLLHDLNASRYLERQLPPVLFLSYNGESGALWLWPTDSPAMGRSHGATIRLMDHLQTRLDSGDHAVAGEIDRWVIGVLVVGRGGTDGTRASPFAALAIADGTSYCVWQYPDGATVSDDPSVTREAPSRITATMHRLAASAVRATRRFRSIATETGTPVVIGNHDRTRRHGFLAEPRLSFTGSISAEPDFAERAEEILYGSGDRNTS